MSLQRCMQETTSTQFVEWQEYFDKEMNMPTKEDWYAAQLAAEVRRGAVKNPRTVKVEHLLLKFTMAGKKEEPLSEEKIERLTAQSKQRWFASTGYKKPEAEKGVS